MNQQNSNAEMLPALQDLIEEIATGVNRTGTYTIYSLIHGVCTYESVFNKELAAFGVRRIGSNDVHYLNYCALEDKNMYFR